MSKNKPVSVMELGVPGANPLQASVEREAWNNKVHELDEDLADFEQRGIREPRRIEPKKAERELAALEMDAWDLKRALDDPAEFAKPTLEARFEDAKRKITAFKTNRSSVSGSDTTSSRS